MTAHCTYRHTYGSLRDEQNGTITSPSCRGTIDLEIKLGSKLEISIFNENSNDLDCRRCSRLSLGSGITMT